MTGSPGNGKTMMCRSIKQICIQNNISYGTVSGQELSRCFSEGNDLQSLLDLRTVTFFDDVDISFFDRAHGSSPMACALLSAMDGINQNSHHIRIFTTNESLSGIDKAFCRPGRIDFIYEFDKPTDDLRKKVIIETWPAEIMEYIENNELLDYLVDETEGFSFAELNFVKTTLVLNKMVSGIDWDINRALSDYDSARKNDVKIRHVNKQVGFHNEVYPQRPVAPCPTIDGMSTIGYHDGKT